MYPTLPHRDEQDFRILRDRQSSASDEFNRAQAGGETIANARMLVQVYNAGNMVSAGDTYFACHPAAIGCPEVEASPCTPVADTSTTILVDFLRGAPSVGDFAVAVAVGGRWVAEARSCLVTFDVYCSGAPVSGASVTVKDGSGTIVASGTTASDGSIQFKLAAGTYTVSASGSTCTTTLIESLTVECSGTYPLYCCSCPTTICVTGCPGGSALVGATVEIQSGSTTVASGTTQSPSGCVTLSIPSAGTYTVAITATGYQGWTGSQSLACNGTFNIALQPTTAPASLVFEVTGCCGSSVPVASITLSDGQSCTTDSGGSCSFWVGTAGTISYTVTAPRYTTVTGSVTVAACPTSGTSIGVAMSPASGYACGPNIRQSDNVTIPSFPVPTTLYLTDSVYGSCTLTYNSTYQGWYGSLTGTFQGACQCPTQPITIGYLLAGCGAPQPGFLASASVANYGVFITGTGCQGCAYYNTDVCPTNVTPSAPDCTTLTSCGFYGSVTMPTPNGSGGLYGAVTGEFPTVYTSPGDSCPFTETIAGSAPFSLDINWPSYVPSGSTCPNCQPSYVAPTSLPWAAAGVTFTITE